METNAWELATLSGLSLINFAEQNLSGSELSTMVDAWTHWATANCSPGVKADRAIANVLNRYTASAIQDGGIRLQAQERIIEAFKALAVMDGDQFS